MAPRKTSPIYLHLPGKQWIVRATTLLLVILGMALFVMSKTNNPAAEKLRTNIMDVVTPILTAAASPFDALSNMTSWLHDMAALREENIVLKDQNRELLKWQAAAKDMQTENQSLRLLLNVVPSQAHHYVTARIVSDMSGPYVHSALLAGGSQQGIKKNQAVVDESGLVGRTLDVGESSARVLLLADINSRVPVITEQTHEKSILAGDNDALPVLSYLATGSKIEVGERIVTSGDGGIFPAGIPVGVVASIDKAKGDVRVQPFVDPAKAEYVSAIDYAF